MSHTIANILTTGFVCLALSGCVGLDMFGASVDTSVKTNTVPSTQPLQAPSDEVTVANAIAAVEPGKLETSSIPWANTSTGSAGVISSIRETADAGGPCRMFRTTRQSYQGIANFDGKACMTDSGTWQLTSFSPVY